MGVNIFAFHFDFGGTLSPLLKRKLQTEAAIAPFHKKSGTDGRIYGFWHNRPLSEGRNRFGNNI